MLSVRVLFREPERQGGACNSLDEFFYEFFIKKGFSLPKVFGPHQMPT